MRVKICGITRPEDARAAEAAGADAIGLNFAEHSRRFVTLEQARVINAAVGPLITRVGVFVDAPLEQVRRVANVLALDAIQLHGEEDETYVAALRPLRVIKALRVTPDTDFTVWQNHAADALLLDGLKPGSGETFRWSVAAPLSGHPRLILAGGLTPHNVAEGVRLLRPYAVDVASGVEASLGIKDASKIQDFVRAAIAAELSTDIQSYPQACG